MVRMGLQTFRSPGGLLTGALCNCAALAREKAAAVFARPTSLKAPTVPRPPSPLSRCLVGRCLTESIGKVACYRPNAHRP